ncbi:MAG: hypothetical protein HKO63_02555 [Acidimicrobiia bacterium]|nr:hypothetical protein [Acidimicrobiia bacterium]NNF87467.1 hypothetical protein [Acidimicrobiia bacterium]NNL12655.1 hypothetical protein [Acidimicrobiia bacterium]NNL97065.1 hypothetical protein [Acidimicrobiia bacterium]
MWHEPNGHDEDFVPLAQRRTFRVVSAIITVLVVLAMLAITLGPYLLDRPDRPTRATTTTGLSV